jgi:hypothetical protein
MSKITEVSKSFFKKTAGRNLNVSFMIQDTFYHPAPFFKLKKSWLKRQHLFFVSKIYGAQRFRFLPIISCPDVKVNDGACYLQYTKLIQSLVSPFILYKLVFYIPSLTPNSQYCL